MRIPSLTAIAAVLSCFANAVVGQTPDKPVETFAIEGRVVDMRGEGVPAAAVQVAMWSTPDAPLAKTVADGDGYFRLAKVPRERSLQVSAKKEHYCEGAAFASPTTRALRLELQHACVVRGTLRNRRGEAVADTIVRATPCTRTLSYVQCDARTDAEGKFVLPLVALAPTRFAAWIEGEGLVTCLQQVAGDLEVTLVPNRGANTRLEVVITGLPAEAPTISINVLPYTSGKLTKFPPPLERPRTNSEGRWVLEHAPDWSYTIYPSSDRFVFAPRQTRVDAGKGPHVLTFAATPKGDTTLLCRANVRANDDKPVAGLPFEMRAANGGDVATATSAEDGSLTLRSPLGKGVEAVIYTTHPDWVVDQSRTETRGMVDRRHLTWHETVVDPERIVDLRVVPACKVHGRLLLDDGRPAAFVSVRLQETLAGRIPQWMDLSWATTDRDGHFHFVGRHALPDDVRVCVDAPEGALTGKPFALAAPGIEQKLGELRLSLPAVIEGVVRDPQARPVPGVRVWLRDWDFARNGQASGSITETLTDRDGRYRFVGVPLGGAWLQLLESAEENGFVGKAVDPFEVEAGKTYEFELQTGPK